MNLKYITAKISCKSTQVMTVNAHLEFSNRNPLYFSNIKILLCSLSIIFGQRKVCTLKTSKRHTMLYLVSKEDWR